MKGIIFTAGLGSRLRPLTLEKPKPLVKVNDKPILSFILDAFEMVGIKDIIVSVGYKKEQVISLCREYPKLNFTFVENTRFDSTSNLYSLYLVRKYLDDDLILIDGDTIAHQTIFQGLMRLQTTSLVRDKSSFFKKSLNIEIGDGQTIKLTDNILKELKTDDDSTTIIKIPKKDTKKILTELENIIEKEKDLDRYLFFMLERLFKNKTIKGQVYNINHKFWHEIDTLEDLKRMEATLTSSTGIFFKS